MFEFSTNFKKINGDRLTLSLIEEKLPTDFESLPYYYFDIILNSSNEVISSLLNLLFNDMGELFS